MIAVFYGEDTYRSREAFRSARAEAERQASAAVRVLRDEDLTVPAFQAAIGSPTLFGDLPPVAVEQLTRFTGRSAALVVDTLRQVSNDQHLLIWEADVPAQNGTVWRALQERGVLTRVDPLGESAHASWIEDRARSQGREITPEASHLLRELFGANLWMLSSTVDVLCLSAEGPRITADDVRAVVPDVPAVELFDTVQAFVEGRSALALRRLTQFRARGEDPRRLFFWILRDLGQLLHLRTRLDGGDHLGVWDVARLFRLPKLASERLLRVAQGASVPVLRTLFDRCALSYYHLNTGRAEADELLEIFALTKLTS